MDARLRELLIDLEPERVLDPVARRTDEAINTFGPVPAVLTDWEAFRRLIVDFGRHVDATVIGTSAFPEMEIDYAWGLYAKDLHKAFGKLHGEKSAFDRARTGVAGGLLGVLREVAEERIEKRQKQHIEARVGVFWQELSDADKLAVMDQYISEFRHLLPSDLVEDGAFRLKMSFLKVLAEHPRMLQRLRNLH